MSIKFESNWSEIEAFLDRMIAAPSSEAILQLELTLASVFADVTAKVHVDTGALRGSGKTRTNVGSHQWTGEVGWGGVSPGFLPKSGPVDLKREHHPMEDLEERTEVVYAWYEARRGGDHDYLRDNDKYGKMFEEVFLRALE